MSEPEKSLKHKASKTKRPRGSDERPLSARVERSLKEVDRLLAESPGAAAHERVMAQLEQAKISALLQLADAVREARREGPPRP